VLCDVAQGGAGPLPPPVGDGTASDHGATRVICEHGPSGHGDPGEVQEDMKYERQTDVKAPTEEKAVLIPRRWSRPVNQNRGSVMISLRSFTEVTTRWGPRSDAASFSNRIWVTTLLPRLSVTHSLPFAIYCPVPSVRYKCRLNMRSSLKAIATFTISKPKLGAYPYPKKAEHE